MVTDQDDSLFDHHPTTTRGFTETVNWALKHAAILTSFAARLYGQRRGRKKAVSAIEVFTKS